MIRQVSWTKMLNRFLRDKMVLKINVYGIGKCSIRESEMDVLAS